MATKQASKRTPAPNKSPSAKPWRYFIAGIVCTLAVEGAYYWSTQKTPLQDASSKAKQHVKAIQKTQNLPDITFYQTLPEQKVEVDVKPLPKPGDVAYNRVLQAGAFKEQSQADQLRARITLLGLTTYIDKTVNKSGNTWYRVIVGPFDSRSKLNQARSVLADQQINTMTLSKSAL